MKTGWKKPLKCKHVFHFMKKEGLLRKSHSPEGKTTKSREQSCGPKVHSNLLQQQQEPNTPSITENILFIHLFSVGFFLPESSMRTKDLAALFITVTPAPRTMSNMLYIVNKHL